MLLHARYVFYIGIEFDCNYVAVNHCGGYGIITRGGDYRSFAGYECCWLFEVNFDAKSVVKFLQASGLELSPGDKTESMFVSLKIIPETILSNGRGNLSGLLNKKTPSIVGQHVESPSMAGDDGVQNARRLK
jgi:hypothetical protein